MNKYKISQKGSIIIEVIAVIALLGVLGPLLFRQITSRNEEVNNVNAASEIRLVKEAFSSFIQAYMTDLNNIAIENNISDGDILEMTANSKGSGAAAALMDRVCDFLPETHGDLLSCSGEGDPAYRLHLFALANADTTITGINYIGLIVPTPNTLPEGLGLKRAARIANLIGADGGIFVDNNVVGVAGGWADITDAEGALFGDTIKDDFDEGVDWNDEVIYLATTAVNGYESNVAVDDFDKDLIQLPYSLGFAKLHAYSYFSVGTDNNCYQDLARPGEATDDDIKVYKDNNCNPDFWVGATNEHSKSGHVYAKNGLHVGTPISQSISPINFNVEDETIPSSDTNAINSARKITVYNADGTEVINIDANGSIIARSSRNPQIAGGKNVTFDETGQVKAINSQPALEELRIQNGRIDTNVYAPKTSEQLGEGKVMNYRVDPSHMSVMNDIRLESKGGVKLSELLPDYIMKSSELVSLPKTYTVKKPVCPGASKRAILVVPNSLPEIPMRTIANNLYITGDIVLQIQAYNASIGKFNINISGTDEAIDQWTVTHDQSSSIKATIQTYCVFPTITGDTEVR